MIFHTYMVYLIMSVIFSFLGTFYSVVFFAFLLLDIVDRSVILNNVIKSVTNNYKQLLMTFLLGILLLYIYAAIGFYSVFRYQYDPDEPTDFDYYCSTVWQCFLSLTNQALTTGNGVGGPFKEIPYHEEGYVTRYFFDLLYFLMILIILLNIIFGIIIDTFAELRDQKSLKDYDETNRCFICNLERTSFEKEGKSFERHVRVEHSIWNYLYYIVYLQSKDKLEYNGTESYIFDKLQKDDLSWFPIQRAMSLNYKTLEDDQEEIKTLIDERLANFETKLFNFIALNFPGNSNLKQY